MDQCAVELCSVPSLGWNHQHMISIQKCLTSQLATKKISSSFYNQLCIYRTYYNNFNAICDLKPFKEPQNKPLSYPKFKSYPTTISAASIPSCKVLRYYSNGSRDPLKPHPPGIDYSAIQRRIQDVKNESKNPNNYDPPQGRTDPEAIIAYSKSETAHIGDESTIKKATAESKFKAFPLSPTSPSEAVMADAMDQIQLGYEKVKQLGMQPTIHESERLATEAMKLFNSALESTGNHILDDNILYHMGISLYTLENWADAAECLLSAVQMNPNLVPAKKLLGECFQQQGKHMEAIHFLDSYFEEFPKYYIGMVDSDGHLRSTDIKVDSETLVAEAAYKRGISYYKIGKLGLDYALEDFKAVVRLGGRWKRESLLWLAQIQADKKDYWKAMAYIDVAFKDPNPTWQMYAKRADIWELLGKEERAEEDRNFAKSLKRSLHFSGHLSSREKVVPQEFDEDIVAAKFKQDTNHRPHSP